MKIAVCYFGNSGGKLGSFGSGGFIDPSYVLKKNHQIFISESENVDYFIHSWSKEYEKKINSIIKPKSSVFEDYNKNIIKSYEEYGLINFNSYLNNSLSEESKIKMNKLLEASQFRWYSNSASIKLMIEYSKKKNIEYDWIIQTRLDLIFLENIVLKNLNKNNFYLPKRYNDKNNSLEDTFFISNFNNAEIFSNIYDERTKYSFLPPYALKSFLDEKKIKYVEFKKLNEDYNLIRNIKLGFKEKIKLRLIKFIDKIIRMLNSGKNILYKI